MLRGRTASTALIDALVGDARNHRGEALMLHGEAGIAKSALLEYAQSRSEGMQVLCGSGYESDSGFTFSLLAQLARPLVPLIDDSPLS